MSRRRLPGGTRATAVVLTLAGFLAGCGEEPTSVEATGSIRAQLMDESSSPPPSDSDAPAATEGPSASHGSGSYSGRLEADAQVSISGDVGVWIDLGPPSAISLALHASEQELDVHGRVEIPVGVYTRVRLALTGAQAQLDAGGAIGGITLSASTTLTVGPSGTVVIEKEVPPFEVRAETHTTVEWVINSHLWVHEENVQDEQVEEQEVEDASDARTSTEPRSGDMV